MHRLAVSAKRKLLLNPKTVAVYVLAIFFTFILAYHHRLSQQSSDGHQINSLRIIQLRGSSGEIFSRPEKETNETSEVCEKPPKEAVADFNTFDLYGGVVANSKSIPAKAKKSRKKEKLKVFILPFTHVDPGWLKTFDDYTKSTNQILDNMHSFMMANEKMRFMWAEFVFFERWWSVQTNQVKQDVKKLVSEGRLELATGSWVMTDEANPYFPVSVDNIVEGFQFIHEHFGVKPSTIWSNDPFGYSNTVPYLFKKSGVHRNVINRIHHKLKATLQSQQAIPFNWRQYFDESGQDDVLTQVLPYTHYDILNSCGPNPSSCCEFDFKRITHWHCPGPAPVNITKANVAAKAETLLSQLETMARMYDAPVLLMMHGDDFRFDMIEEWHQHHDNFLPVFDEINKGDRAEVHFGTFNDYFTAMEGWYEENKADAKPATVSGDFFPYMCALGDYWTGYFTTRPFYKRQGRLLHSLIRSADIMLSRLRPSLKQRKIDEYTQDLELSRRNLSLFQHHDAITGTSKVSVMDNYSELLHASILSTKAVLEKLGEGVLDSFPRIHDGVEIQAMFDFTNNSKDKEVKLVNTLLFTRHDIFQVRVSDRNIELSMNGKPIESQLEPYFLKGKPEADSFLVVFRAKIPPLSMVKVRITKKSSTEFTKTTTVEGNAAIDLGGHVHFVLKLLKGRGLYSIIFSTWKISQLPKAQLELETPYLKTSHNAETGAILTITKNGSIATCQQTWQKYRDAAGGAYLMRLHTNPTEVAEFKWIKISGPLRQSVYQFSDSVSQRISLKNVEGPSGEEIDVSMSIDITKERNTELMTRFSTKWQRPVTYTDSVGMQLLRREYYKLPVQENYYPMPTAVVLESGDERLSIVSNVEHGARFLEEGTAEINIDRILNQDDGKGLGSGSDSIPVDLKPVDMNFKLVFEKTAEKSANSHYSTHTLRAQQAVQSVIYPVVLLDSEAADVENIDEIEANSELKFPCDVQLLTVRPLSEDRELITFYRHATVCSTERVSNCGGDLKKAIFKLLLKSGVKRVQRTDLSGVTTVGKAEKIENLSDIDLKTFDFLTFVLYR